jgi:hypothetical protein
MSLQQIRTATSADKAKHEYPMIVIFEKLKRLA